MAGSLRGSLLIAGPQLLDPNFRRTVVLVADHGEEGAMGVILNRPSGMTVADAAPDLEPLIGSGSTRWKVLSAAALSFEPATMPFTTKSTGTTLNGAAERPYFAIGSLHFWLKAIERSM